MLHISGSDFDQQPQLSQLQWVVTSETGQTGPAENYARLPTSF